MSRRKPGADFMRSHLEVMKRLDLTDASPELQRAFGLVWRSGTGHVVLKWLIAELHRTIYSLGAPTELAVAQAVRVEFATLIEDMIRRGQGALDAEHSQQTPVEKEER